ncbi:MAG TPA: glycosyltransferase family 4 protein [Candidatus Acidoferrales bacterium]|nr:glycosyltransferase family 4 protein [Candidatus Acidoferrales bacterium]
MKILIYTEYFLPIPGGVQTSVLELATGLMELRTASESIEVTVVTRTSRGADQDDSYPFRVVRRPGLAQFVRLIREADVIHLAGPPMLPLALSYLLRKPFVIEHHGYQAICPNGLLFVQPSQTCCPGEFMRGHYAECVRCCANTMGQADGLLKVLSTFPRRWFCKRAAINIAITRHVSARLTLPRTVTVYYGMGQAELVSNGNHGLDSGPLRVAYVGRLVSEKGLRTLLQAADLLRRSGCNFRLAFIGDGPEREDLERLAESLGVRELTTFTGFLRNSDLAQAVNGVDVVVMPSIWEETAGLSAIEHMMRGRVVIAADIGGLGEVVGDAGLKFPSGDAQALTSCIRRVIDDPSLRVSLGSSARTRATRFFTRDRMIEEHVSIYREAISR